MLSDGKRQKYPQEIQFQTKPDIAMDQIPRRSGGRCSSRNRSGRCGLWQSQRVS